jgi:hypothetical protein
MYREKEDTNNHWSWFRTKNKIAARSEILQLHHNTLDTGKMKYFDVAPKVSLKHDH